jgi:putative glycosyltransferase
MELAIVATLYNSATHIHEFHQRASAVAQELAGDDYEIVLVNDGSPDNSLDLAIKLAENDGHLVVVDLSRNFGHHHAILAGLQHACGDLIFLIDCDLEVPPEALLEFVRKMNETNCDMVFGYQESRKGGWFERISGDLFWKGFNLLSETKIPDNSVTERLMTRRFVHAVLQMGDYNLFLGGMMSWTGFAQVGIPIVKQQREGQSSYTLMKRIGLTVNAVSSFSSQPLVWLFNMGVSITLLSFGYVAYLVFRKLVFGDALLGFTSMMGFIAITLGILTTAIGLVGIYLGKVFNQVQNRPNFIVKDIYRTPRPTVLADSRVVVNQAAPNELGP